MGFEQFEMKSGMTSGEKEIVSKANIKLHQS
jgi:hypothetical protein